MIALVLVCRTRTQHIMCTMLMPDMTTCKHLPTATNLHNSLN